MAISERERFVGIIEEFIKCGESTSVIVENLTGRQSSDLKSSLIVPYPLRKAAANNLVRSVRKEHGTYRGLTKAEKASKEYRLLEKAAKKNEKKKKKEDKNDKRS